MCLCTFHVLSRSNIFLKNNNKIKQFKKNESILESNILIHFKHTVLNVI